MDVDKVLEMLRTARATFERGFSPNILSWRTDAATESPSWVDGAGLGEPPAWIFEALVGGHMPEIEIHAHRILSRGAIDQRTRQNAEEAVASWLANAALLAAPHPPYRREDYGEKASRWLVWIESPEIIKHVDMERSDHRKMVFSFTCEASCYVVTKREEL